MTLLQSIVLGIIQGLTEFLPVSSSGHLIFLPRLFGWSEHPLAFDVILHMGTLLAVVFYFRKKLWKLILAFFNYKKDLSDEVKADKKLAWLIIFSVIPAGTVGYFFGDYLEATFRSSHFIAFSLIGWGIVLWLADSYSKKKANVLSLDKISWKNNLVISFAQILALLPGISRSGITMTGGLFSKLNKETAAEYAFLISVPIIFLAGADKGLSLIKHGIGTDLGLSVLVCGFVFSAISGFLAISLLMKIIKKWSFTPFVVYRIIVGILILVLL